VSRRDTIVWITGATRGIGEALARTVPYESARVINISRSVNTAIENVHADIADPTGWDAIERHLATELAAFRGTRAIFVHNAFVPSPVGFVGEVDPAGYRQLVFGTAAAPLVVGEAFLRHLPDGVEGGLVMVSSAAARVPFAGSAVYGGGKAAMEQWVRVVRSELDHRRSGTWVIAIRPGAVDTPSMRDYAEADPADNPTAVATKAALESGQIDSADVAARRMWDVIVDGANADAVVLLGEMIAPPRPA
jgi:NADP-dependent 3-hydroxy acid dehydrogenase YdfG